MKTLNKFGAMLGMVGMLALAACGGTGGPFGSSEPASPAAMKGIPSGAAIAGTGVIQSIEPVQQEGKTIQRFTIRMDNTGARQTVTHSSTSGFSVNDRVRIEGNTMRRY